MRGMISESLLNELKELLGEKAANEMMCAFLNAPDAVLLEIKQSLQQVLAVNEAHQ